MKYLHLVWAALLRRKTRTVLTILSVLVAFLLFGLLDGVRAAFNAGETLAGVDRMVVSSRFSIIQPLPESLVARVQAVPGVRKVTWATGIDLKLDGGLCDRVLGAVPGRPANKAR